MAVSKKKSTGASLDEIMNELRHLGTERNVRVYRRYGAEDPLFGVSYASLKEIAKRLRTNQALAAELWATRNFDAMNLAGLIADPQAFDDNEADHWLRSVACYPTSIALAGVLGKSSRALSRVKAWTESWDEFTRTCGYDTLSFLLAEGISVDESFLRVVLKRIEKEIQASPNRARHSMNAALIAIGGFRPELREEAIATAKRIGKVEVDHHGSSCVTPEAIPYMEKITRRGR
jgi:3-methyladenine DNA glycosylase AlkD